MQAQWGNCVVMFHLNLLLSLSTFTFIGTCKASATASVKSEWLISTLPGWNRLNRNRRYTSVSTIPRTVEITRQDRVCHAVSKANPRWRKWLLISMMNATSKYDSITFLRFNVFFKTSVCPISSPSSWRVLEGFPGKVVEWVEIKYFHTLSPHTWAIILLSSTLATHHLQVPGTPLHPCTFLDTSMLLSWQALWSACHSFHMQWL